MQDPYQVMTQWSNRDPLNKLKAQAIVDNTIQIKCYAFGLTQMASALNQRIELVGFIDDFTKQTEFEGKPIVKLEQLAHEADVVIINCVNLAKPRTALNRIKQLGFSDILHYHDFLKVDTELMLPDFIQEARHDVLMNYQRWHYVYLQLADATSREIFNNVYCYRLTGDPSYTRDYSFTPTEQYFEDFMQYQQEVFVDAGGFTGDTTEEFCLRYPDYSKVFLIEPGQDSMRQAKERLADFNNIIYVPKGVSDKVESLAFSDDLGSSSLINEQGSQVIDVAPIDDLVNEPVSVIKMDLEGWEMNALRGSAQHILNDHPKLAISVYHKTQDIWQIYEYIMSLRQDYTIYLRHYSEARTETIMFFMPK